MLSGEVTNTNFIVFFYPIRARTHDLPHSRRAAGELYRHRCVCVASWQTKTKIIKSVWCLCQNIILYKNQLILNVFGSFFLSSKTLKVTNIFSNKKNIKKLTLAYRVYPLINIIMNINLNESVQNCGLIKRCNDIINNTCALFTIYVYSQFKE